MGKDINKVIKYFSIFGYPPDFDEIYTFFPKKTSKKALKTAILELGRQKKIKTIYKAKLIIPGNQRYTIGEYTTREYVRNLSKRKKISRNKLNGWRFRAYIKLISFLPQVKLIGLSGSISMLNAKTGDDIDLFIITSKKRLFTARFLCLILSQLFGLRRKYGERETRNKVCLNLFFDEANMAVPRRKRTIFVGHEVLQMKPLVNKSHVYERFLEANQWVYGLFPNAKIVASIKYQVSSIKQKKLNAYFLILNSVVEKIEQVLKSIQLRLINTHRTTELITGTQLWFHPEDFEKKIKATF